MLLKATYRRYYIFLENYEFLNQFIPVFSKPKVGKCFSYYSPVFGDPLVHGVFYLHFIRTSRVSRFTPFQWNAVSRATEVPYNGFSGLRCGWHLTRPSCCFNWGFRTSCLFDSPWATPTTWDSDSHTACLVIVHTSRFTLIFRKQRDKGEQNEEKFTQDQFIYCCTSDTWKISMILDKYYTTIN